MLIVEKILVLVLVLAAFFGIWRLESGWRIIISPFLLAMYFELVRVFPAFFFADLYLPLSDSFALWTAFVAFLCMLTGFVLVYCWPVANPNQVLRFARNSHRIQTGGADSVAAVILAFLLVGLGVAYFDGLPAAAQSLVSLLTRGGDSNLASMVGDERLALTKGAYFGGEYRGQGLFLAVQQVGWTMVCIYALLNHLRKRTSASLVGVSAAIVVAWIFVAGTGARAPFLNVLICLFAAYTLIRPLRARGTVAAILAVVATAILLSLYSPKMFFILADSSGVGDFAKQAIAAIIERIFIGNGINDVYAIEFVRAHELDLQLGKVHVRDFLTAIPGIQYGQPLSYTLYTLIDPTGTSTTFRSATYLADVFVDFHLPGVVLTYLTIGVIIAIAQKLLFNVRLTAWSMATAVTVVFYVVNVLRGGPVAVLTSMLVISLIFVAHSILRTVVLRTCVAPGQESGPLMIQDPVRDK